MQNITHKNIFFWLRNFLILGQILLWLMAKFIWEIQYPFLVLGLSVLYLLFNLFSWLVNTEFSDRWQFTHLLLDVTVLSLFFYLTGGSSNPFIWFLIAPIIYSGFVLSPKHTWIISFYSILSYTVLMYFFQTIPLPTNEAANMSHNMTHATSFGQHLIGMWLGFMVLSLLISWVISHLMKNIQHKEDLLIQAHAKQAENEKIVALATLATGSAHELATPLATISLITHDLLDNETIQQQHKKLAIIASQVNRCKESLANITASTRTTQAISGAVVSVDILIQRVQSHLSHPHSDTLQWQMLHHNQAKLHLDKTLIQALVNIIHNALESQATQVMIKCTTNSMYLNLSIADNGEGLSTDFGIKNQSEKNFGMGLGLFLAKTTIERFNGTIEIVRTDKNGTELLIKLPVIDNE